MNYISLFNEIVNDNKNKTIIVDSNGNRKTSYYDFDILSNKVADKIHKLGIDKHSYIIINMERSMEYIAAYFGILKAGCAVVPLVNEYPQERINYIKNHCNAKLYIEKDFFNDIDNYDNFLDLSDDNSPALLVYTSGSTGKPKGILYTNADFTLASQRISCFFDNIDELSFAAVALMSFAAHVMEYPAVFLQAGTTHIIDDKTRKDISLLEKYYQDNKVTMGYIPPQMLRLFNGQNTNIKRIITGGERAVNIYSDNFEIYNMYGMSETNIVSVFNIDKKYPNTPIGRGMKDAQLLIMDDDHNILDENIEGEICIKGLFNTSYFNDDLSTKKVTQNQDKYTIWHTGDVGYKDDNGNVIYVNRKDWMVKINGQRVETLEIENLLCDINEISNACVKAFLDDNDQTYLVAFYSLFNDINEDEIRNKLLTNLPQYMIPRFFVKMDELPKNANGKLNRLALSAPEINSYKEKYTAPTTDIEKTLCKAFEKTLNCGKVGIDDDFFALGGDSIKVLMLINEANIDELEQSDILKAKTVRNISMLLCNKDKEEIIHKEKIEKITPLTDSQRGVYFECIDSPNSLMYNIPMSLKLNKNINLDRFIESVKTVIKHHKAFFVTIKVPNGTPSMVYEEKDISFDIIDCDDVNLETKKFIRPFDLENGPLYRVAIIRDKKYISFVYDIHHLIFDGTSNSIFIKEISNVYNGYGIENEKINIFDISNWELKLKDSQKHKKASNFYKAKFDGVECDSTPIPDVIEEINDEHASRIVINTNSKFSNREIHAFSRKNKISENTLFLSSFAYALSKINGSDDCLFCTADSGRQNINLNNTIGMFVKTLPLYFNIDEKTSINDFLNNTQKYLYETIQNDSISFSELSSLYSINTDIVFVYQSELINGETFDNNKLNLEMLDTNDSQTKLDFMVLKNENSFKLIIHFKKNMYSEAFIRSFSNMYLNIINEFLHVNTLSEIKLIDRNDILKIQNYNQTEEYYDSTTNVVDLFKSQAKKNPENICVVYRDKKYTYKEVDEITDRFASLLISKGIKKENVVGILIPRCEFMVIASLSVLKAGAAYMPLDPTYPKERLNLMVQDSEASLLLFDKEFSDIIDQNFKGLRINVSDILSCNFEITDLPKISPDDKFVMLYTSGSTGIPKGVIFEHSNTLVTTEFVKKYFNITSESHVTSYASYGFDAHAFDIYPAITSGAQLHVIDDEIRLDFPRLRDYFNENEITHTVMTTQVGRQFSQLQNLNTLKHISVAGEKLTPLTPPESINLYNLYGPTEGSIITSAFKVDKKYKDIPIGKAVDNLKTYIVDKNQRLLPIGAIGELLICGPHVTRGYKNRDEITNKVYTKNIYENIKGYERLYHTGDIVRMLPDGNLQFIGRRDHQVKIRGYRIELTEIEEVIRTYDDINDATVAAFDDKSGGKYVVAYIVSNKNIDIEKLCDYIKEKKPPYMVPAIIMQIDKIPLNQNHKVNKKALPVPERKIQDIVPPENELQKEIFDIISEVINHKEFGIDTDIYDAGLTSIGAVKLNVNLSEKFSIPVKIRDIKSNNTVRKLEKFISSSKPNEEFTIQEDYPLTETQKGIFVECISSPDTTIYNIPVLVKLSENINIDKLKDSIIKAIDCHSYVKTTLFTDSYGNIRQKRNDDAKVEIKDITLDKLKDKNLLLKPFKLLESPLYKIAIIHTQGDNYLFMDFHHIISDGTSESILFRDISNIYLGKDVESEKYTGFEAALDEEKQRNSKTYTIAKEYYNKLLSSYDEAITPKIDVEDKNKKSGIVKYESNDAKAILDYCSKNNLSVNAFFNAAFAFVLSKFINNESVTYATIYNGRNDSRLKDSVTMLIKTLPVAATIDNNKEIKKFINEIQTQLLDNMANDIYSFAEISAQFKLTSDIMFAYQGDEIKLDNLCGEKIELIEFESNAAKANISINIYLRNNKFSYVCEYDPSVYSKDFSYYLADAINEACNSFITSNKLGEISILSKKAKQTYDLMNNSDVQISDKLIHQIFEECANNNENKIAVIANKEKLNYRELNNCANKVANSLISLGINQDNIVGVLLNRTKEIFIAELGILKAGGAFLPLVPSYPDDRIDYCLSNAESPYIITTNAIKNEKSNLFSDKTYKVLTIEELLENQNTSNPELQINNDSLAYCIYTSGSTGTPKGVMIEHKNISNFIQVNHLNLNFFNKENNGAILACSSISFDMSIYELYLSLCNGKTVCIASEEEFHNPLLLKDLMIENNVQMMVCTPSFMNNIVNIKEFYPALNNLVSIVVGAEAFPVSLFDALRKISPNIQIINGYGPTETTICSSIKELKRNEAITIGKPEGNVKYYVIDKNKHILPPYAVGELIICGNGVGRGYVKLPEKTNSVFFNLFGYKAYHSGDSVRLTSKGEIDFSGRIDNQVKLRGFRIELDEIENVIVDFKNVKSSKVIVRNNGTEDYLAAFFTAKEKIDINELTSYLQSRLTYYMVPSVIMQLDEMPLTTNGKIDKKAFPETTKQTIRKKKKRAPKQSLEERLCEIFKSILSLDEVYADDNFFELGGTSLSASKVTMMLMSENIEVKYGDIFDNPTPELLSQFIEERDKSKNIKVKTKSQETTTRKALQYNKIKYAEEVKREPLGNILLTGGTGFLGIHVLKELFETETGHIYCLVRKGSYDTPEKRLKTMLVYYFSKGFEKELEERVTLIETDISDDSSFETLKELPVDTIINCAACVKHFADDDILERINVHGVENLIKVAKYKSCRLIQISTVTIAGMHTDESYEKRIVMHEDELFMIDDMDNKYVISKYNAELKMLDAIEDGLRGKIIRVGNLMGRHSDGEFQANLETNMFLSGIRGFSVMGKYPISHMTDPMSFSPIDCTAKAVVLLSGTNDKFTAFNCDSRYGFDEMKIIDACNRNGITILPEDDKIYYEEFQKKLGDDKVNSLLNGLAAYDIKDAHIVETDNLFTTNILYRIGFSWPLVDDTYLDKAINSIMTLDYFNVDDI